MIDLKLNDYAAYVKQWRERKGFETNWANVPEKLMLVVTELAEAMEEYRRIIIYGIHLKGTDEAEVSITPAVSVENYTYVNNFEIEIADVFIRLLDLCGTLTIDIEQRILDKMARNETREYKHGKQL